jgi:hypothetical protein
MRLEKFIRRSMSVCCTILVAGIICVAAPAFAQGKGGGGGGGPSGTIYFINGAGGGYSTNYMWSMNADGSGVTQLGFWGVFNVPSRTHHNGHRWYLTTLTIPGEFYPDGATQRSEVFAIRDDYSSLNNNSETRVQLTDDPTLQPYFGWFGSMQWLPGDVGASFRAARWSGGTRVEGGLYTVDVVYRADGNIIGGGDPPTAPALSFPLDGNGLPVVGRHSWGSSATKVAYADSTGTELWVADLSTGTQTRIYSGSVYYLDWAQDGSKIVFGSGTIRTIKSDGSSLKTVIKPFYNLSGFGHAYFSPNGAYITCVGIVNLAGGGQDNDVFRATSSGGSLTNLTNTPSLMEVPVAWR